MSYTKLVKSVILNLNMAESVKRFVEIASAYDYNMDLRQGKFVVNAKSILGIFSLQLDKPVVLEIFDNNDSSDSLLDELTQFMVG